MYLKIALAAAAVAGIATTAQAADLAKKAPAAAEYVKVCDAYGAGFFYIPGSDTCLKIGGYVLADLRSGSGKLSRFDTSKTVYGNRTRSGNQVYTRARTELGIDARTATEFGLLRSYINIRTTLNSGDTTTTTVLQQGFIQFGGLTVGMARSAFDFAPAGYGLGVDYSTAAYSTAYVNQFGYTYSFGSGLTASLSIEDPSATDTNNSGAPHRTGSNGGTSIYGGVRSPDVVGNVAIAQAWGSAQLSAVYHQNYGLSATSNAFAVQGGVEVNLPFVAKGDKLYALAAYTDGAVGYSNQLSTATGRVFEVYKGSSSLAIGNDFVYAGGKNHNTKAWNVQGGFHHEFTPTWETNIDAGVASVDGYGARDLKYYGAGIDLRWKPVKGFYIAGDVEYGDITYSTATAAAVGTSKSHDGWTGVIRVRRNF